MCIVKKLRQWLQDKATRAFTKFYHSPVEETEDRMLENGDTIDVYWFDGEDSQILGQARPFGTILLNRSLVGQLSDQTQELVFQHELSYIRRGLSRVVSSTGWSSGAFSGYCSQSPSRDFSVLSIGLFVATNRIEETTADLHALQAVGESDFLDGYREVSTVTEDMLGNRILRTLFYTHPERTVYLRQFLRRVDVMKS